MRFASLWARAVFFQKFFEDMIIEAEIRNEAFDLLVLYIQRPQLPGIVDIQAIVFVISIVDGLL